VPEKFISASSLTSKAFRRETHPFQTHSEIKWRQHPSEASSVQRLRLTTRKLNEEPLNPSESETKIFVTKPATLF
jgi:hypothetical protein